ncbi:HNH endonuclease [Nocardioides hankookensis]|uniref:HNH endonuclease n=1 Tax=Nocardioides hankookensis TaxID=443157 RepID=A0ABW1LIZ3_9ACTN
MCHAHHDPPWSRGGRTDIDHSRLLCPRHHALEHRDTS